MTIRRMALGALAALALTASALAEVTVLGVPLEMPLKPAPRLCPANTDNAKNICWVSEPYVARDGDRLGMVHLPNADARPQWAAYASFDAHMSKRSEIHSLKATVFDGHAKHEIARSITARFGLPEWTTLAGANPSGAAWNGADAHVEMTCADDRCWVEFESIPAHGKRMKEVAERKARDAARPRMP